MFLTYGDLVRLFPKSQGIDDNLHFKTVSIFSNVNQSRGLFIPLNENSGELKEAIQNGAIGAIWDDKHDLPAYVPNHFPIFFSGNLHEAVETILNSYMDKLTIERNDIMNMTKFLFIEEKLLNVSMTSYDKSVLKSDLKTKKEGIQ